MEHTDDGGQLILQPRSSTALPQLQPSVLDRFQHPECLIERQHDTAGNRIVEGVSIAHAVSMNAGCDDVLVDVPRAALPVRDVLHPSHVRLPELPIVGGLGLVVITRDKKIRSRPAEAELVVAAGVRGFVLTSAGDLSTWDTLSLLVRQWDALERHLAQRPSGPLLAALTSQGVRPLRIRG